MSTGRPAILTITAIAILATGLITITNSHAATVKIKTDRQTEQIVKDADIEEEQPKTDDNNKKIGLRVVHFPKDRSLGVLYLGRLRPLDSFWWQGWEMVGQAKGNVQVPIDKDVQLAVSEARSRDVSALTTLKPNDLQVLTLVNIDDATLAHLAGLTGLRQLALYSSPEFKGEGLAHLSRLTALEALLLGHSGLMDNGLKYIASIRSLRRLDLSYTQITDAGLVHLRDLASLEKLTAYGVNITGNGFSALVGLDSLRELSLNHSAITDEGLGHLAKLKSLEKLSLYNTSTSNVGLAMISELKSLRELNLGNTNVTDAGVGYLAKLTSLEGCSLKVM